MWTPLVTASGKARVVASPDPARWNGSGTRASTSASLGRRRGPPAARPAPSPNELAIEHHEPDRLARRQRGAREPIPFGAAARERPDVPLDARVLRLEVVVDLLQRRLRARVTALGQDRDRAGRALAAAGARRAVSRAAVPGRRARRDQRGDDATGNQQRTELEDCRGDATWSGRRLAAGTGVRRRSSLPLVSPDAEGARSSRHQNGIVRGYGESRDPLADCQGLLPIDHGARARSTCCSSCPTLVILGAFLFYPLVYGVVLSVHDTEGFDHDELRRTRALRSGAARRRGVPPQPAEHAPVHGRRRRAPDGARPPARGPPGRREAGQGLVHLRVLRALRPRPGGGRRGLEVPLCAVLRDRGDGRVGPRDSTR